MGRPCCVVLLAVWVGPAAVSLITVGSLAREQTLVGPFWVGPSVVCPTQEHFLVHLAIGQELGSPCWEGLTMQPLLVMPYCEGPPGAGLFWVGVIW